MIYDDEVDDYGPHEPTEINLSNGKLFLLFLLAAAICGGCFGFGYSMGKRSKPMLDATVAAPVTSPSSAAGSKPAAGSANQRSALPTQVADVTVETVNSGADSSTSVPADSNASAPPATSVAEPLTKSVTQLAKVATDDSSQATRSLNVKTEPVEVPAAGGRSFVVQVAAVTHKGDADMLVTALHRKGYSVTEVNGGDSLIHVQVGPFANQKDAAAMRDRLSNDGYNAIVK